MCLLVMSPEVGIGLELLAENQKESGRRMIGGSPASRSATGRKHSMAHPAAVRLPAARLLQVPFGRLLFRLYPASQLFVTHTIGDEHHAFVVIHHRYFNYRKSSRISRRTSAPIFSLICLTMPSMASFSTMR